MNSREGKNPEISLSVSKEAAEELNRLVCENPDSRLTLYIKTPRACG